MARLQAGLLSESERDTLHEHTLTVLEEVGVAYNTPVAMAVLEGTGAILDREHRRAQLPRALVARCLETAPRTVLLAARNPAHDVRLGDGSLSFTTDGTVTYVVDDESGQRHEASAADLRMLMPLFDALPNADSDERTAQLARFLTAAITSAHMEGSAACRRSLASSPPTTCVGRTTSRAKSAAASRPRPGPPRV